MVKRNVGAAKRLSAVFLSLCMLSAAVPVGATGTEYIPTGNDFALPDETVDMTPDADKFTVDGKGFVLLDEDESAYYVTTTDAYGDMETISDGTEGGFENPTGKQINYDSYKSDAFLNGDFLTKGNNFTALGNDTTTYYKLPQGIIDNIDNNHVWKRFVNDYRSGTGVLREYTTGVSLLSWTDFTTYAGKLGAVDGFLNSDASNADMYFLRDTNNWGGDSALAMFCTADKKCKHWGRYVRLYGFLRPAFYLKKDFFKTTKINLATMGKNVKDAIRTVCTDDELIELYGVRDCKTYFGMDIDIAYIELSLRNGKDIGDANILDTVIATAENAVVDEFCWEVSDDDGNSWYKAEDETGNSIILTAEYAGKLLRCRAESDGEEISSAVLRIPNPEIVQTQIANLEGFMEETPDKYRFTVDGRSFVLLDTFDNDKSTYYVTTTEAYGDMQTLAVESGDFEVPTGKQINYDAYKSDAFLNENFLKNGNNFSVLSDDSTTYYDAAEDSTAGQTIRYGLVTEVIYAMDDDGGTAYRISYIDAYGGGTRTSFVDSNCSITDAASVKQDDTNTYRISEGDFVCFSTDAAEMIVKAKVIYDAETGTWASDLPHIRDDRTEGIVNCNMEVNEMFHGYVLQNGTSHIRLTGEKPINVTDSIMDSAYVFNIANAKVYKYISWSGKLVAVDASEIIPFEYSDDCSEVVTGDLGGLTPFVVIYN